MGVNLIVGYAGQETLAQAAFVGIGAYLTALTTKAGVPFGVAFLASGVLTFLVGIAARLSRRCACRSIISPSSRSPSRCCVWLVFRNEQWLTGGVMGISDIERPSLFGLLAAPSRELLLVRAGDHGGADLRAVVDRALALGPRLHGAARKPAPRREPGRRCPPLHAARLCHRARPMAAWPARSTRRWSSSSTPARSRSAPRFLYLLMVVIGGAGSFLGPVRRRRHRGAAAGMAALCRRLLSADLRRARDGHDGCSARAASSDCIAPSARHARQDEARQRTAAALSPSRQEAAL